VPPQVNGTTRPPPPDVGGFPSGDTASGVKDLVGLVWQWTDEFADDHTRAGLVRGGTYYSPSTTGGGWHALWYFPAWLPPEPVPVGHSGTMSVNLNTHNKLLLMAPSYDRHGTVGFRCVADAPGYPPPPPPLPPAGCASGTCTAFCENALVQGCAAALAAGVSMRAPPTGKPCGGALGPCAAAADACAAGWRPCLSDFSVPALSAAGFRAAMGAAACAAGDAGRFVAASSHANCSSCAAGPTSVDFGCLATGCGAESLCCGMGCVPAGCKSGLYPNATLIFGGDQQHGCGNVATRNQDGVLCCKL